MAASGITSPSGWAALFSSHPPIEERIAALQQLR
jgi:heat shock protein HtpX